MGETGIEFRSAFEETIGGTVKQRNSVGIVHA